MKRIYLIVDTLSESAVGPLMLFPHDAPAVRFFNELLADPQTPVGRHPSDHQLLCVGVLLEQTFTIDADQRSIVHTGAAWLASQPETTK